MGQGPSLQQAINDKSVDSIALEKEIDRVRGTLNNTEIMAIAYINDHTNGVILGRDSQKPEIMFSNIESYTKYSEEYSLKALDAVIDTAIGTAKNSMKVAASEGSDPKAVLDLIESVGGLIKSGLALAASSSSTTTKLEVTFSQFNIGDKNYAVYNAVNSGIVKASNAWGNKDLTLVAQTTILAVVRADANLTEEQAYQDDLNTLLRLEKARNKEMIEAVEKGINNADALKLVEQYIEDARQNITNDRNALAGKNLATGEKLQ